VFKRSGDDANGVAAIDRLTSLPLADRAAEMLPVLTSRLTEEGRPLQAMYLLQVCFGMSPGLRSASDSKFASVLALNDAFQALVSTRMLVRIESDGASHGPSYWPSADAAAALEPSDALAVITRRLAT
jgi:hypothetical protein